MGTTAQTPARATAERRAGPRLSELPRRFLTLREGSIIVVTLLATL
jgi:hypothetical protein